MVYRRSKRWGPHDGITALIRRCDRAYVQTGALSHCALSKHHEDNVVCKPGIESVLDTNHAGTLDFSLLAARIVRKKISVV